VFWGYLDSARGYQVTIVLYGWISLWTSIVLLTWPNQFWPWWGGWNAKTHESWYRDTTSFLLEQITLHDILARVHLLCQAAARGRLNCQEHKRSIKKVDNILSVAKVNAEQYCCKFHMGRVPWCPRISRAINQMLYWKGIKAQWLQSKIGSYILKVQAKKAGLMHTGEHVGHLDEEIQLHIKKACKHYERLKHDDLQWDTWLAQMVEEKAKTKGQMAKAIWKQIHSTKQACTTAC